MRDFPGTRVRFFDRRASLLMEPEVERRLTDRAKEDPEAFAQLYDHFLPVVYGYVMRRVRNRELAEDITSETFEKALRSIRRLRKGTSFKVWLYRIAGNTIIDHYRATGRRRTYSLAEADDMANGKSGREVEKVEIRSAVLSLLEQLPDTYREALVLHFLEELSVEEMAEVLQISHSACYMRVYRGIKNLAELMEEQGIRNLEGNVV